MKLTQNLRWKRVNFNLRGGLTMEEWIEECLSPGKHLNDDMQNYVKSR